MTLADVAFFWTDVNSGQFRDRTDVDGNGSLLEVEEIAGGLRVLLRPEEPLEKVAAELLPLVDDGYDIVALTASCGLMMKFEWPLILPENAAVKRLSAATRDICEYVVEVSKAHGLAPGLAPVAGGVAIHHACHRPGTDHR